MDKIAYHACVRILYEIASLYIIFISSAGHRKLPSAINQGACFETRIFKDIGKNELVVESSVSVYRARDIPQRVVRLDRIDTRVGRIHSVCKPGAIGMITLKKGDGERVEDRDHKGISVKRFFSFYQEDEFAQILRENSFEVLESYETDHSDKKWLVFFVKTTG